jgi:hypothetical protein
MRRLLITAAAALTLLAGCGGADLGTESGGSSTGTTGTGTTGTGTTGTGTTTTYSMGNGSGSGFQSGVIGISSTNVSAGGTTSLTITVVDQNGVLYTASPVIVSYSSTCISSGLAVIAPSGTSTAGTTADTVTSSTGTIDATYTAKGCSGQDVITASAAVGSATLTATGTVTVAAAAIGSIQFESATPQSIGLKGTGLNETSTVVFKVVDATGGARPGVTVNFSLNTSAGGISLSPAMAVSAADGTVQTVVSSGTAHTAVRVTATISSPALSTESSNLTVTTGLPASNAFSIAVGAPSYVSLACSNVEAYGIDLIAVPVTVQLADRYNNPAPDGTSVAFTTNGGHIGGSCTTPLASPGDGECLVTWTSANPRPGTSSTPPTYRNGRAQILATAIGEESFDDVNSTGYYQAGDPFSDLGEPYLDANESGAYVKGDYFLDYYNTGTYQGPSGKFIGITCTASACSESTLAIGVEHQLIMSTSGALVFVYDSTSAKFIPANTTSVSLAASPAPPAAPNSIGLNILVVDTNGNAMAAGTTVAITTSIGTLSGAGATYTVGCNTSGGPGSDSPNPTTLAAPLNNVGGNVTGVQLTAPSSAGSGSITITVTSPQSKSITSPSIQVNIT